MYYINEDDFEFKGEELVGYLWLTIINDQDYTDVDYCYVTATFDPKTFTPNGDFTVISDPYGDECKYNKKVLMYSPPFGGADEYGTIMGVYDEWLTLHDYSQVSEAYTNSSGNYSDD